MMALETGAERKSEEWLQLLGSVELRFGKTWPADFGLEAVSEAVRITQHMISP